MTTNGDICHGSWFYLLDVFGKKNDVAFRDKNCDLFFAKKRDFSQLNKCLEKFFFAMDHDFSRSLEQALTKDFVT